MVNWFKNTTNLTHQEVVIKGRHMLKDKKIDNKIEQYYDVQQY